MAHVQRRGPGRWMVTYKDPDGRRRARSFGRKIDAERFLATVTVDLLRGDWVDPDAGRVTLHAYARQWIEQRGIRPTTRERYRAFLTYIDRLGHVALADLKPSTLRTWQAGVTRDLAPSTARVVRGILGAILKDAVVDRLISANPLDGVPAPPKPRRRLVQPLPVGTVRQIEADITDRYRAAVVVGYGCGLRRGEVFGLALDRIDFLRRELRVDQALVQTIGEGVHYGPPKTAASVRVVPMPQLVIDALALHLTKYPVDGQDAPIFTTARGQLVARSTFAAAWRDAEIRGWARQHGRPLMRDGRIPAATLDAWQEAHPAGPSTRFHDLRHFYASTLIRAGENVRVVQERLGHENAAETLGTYSHLWPHDAERTRRAIDAAFRDDGDEGTAGVLASV